MVTAHIWLTWQQFWPVAAAFGVVLAIGVGVLSLRKWDRDVKKFYDGDSE